MQKLWNSIVNLLPIIFWVVLIGGCTGYSVLNAHKRNAATDASEKLQKQQTEERIAKAQRSVSNLIVRYSLVVNWDTSPP